MVGWRGPCCCGGGSGCAIGSDDFDRADSTSLGSDWAEDAGSWSIASNKLYTASTDAVCEYQTAHPDSEAYFHVTVDVTFATDGDKAKVLLGDTVEVEMEYDTSGNHTINFYSNSTLVKTSNVSVGGSTFRLYLYYSAATGAAVLYFGSTQCAFSFSLAVPSTYYVALGTGDTNSGGISFDNFAFDKGYSASNTSCLDKVCTVSCVGGCTPTTQDVMLVTLNMPAGTGTCDCSNWNGTYALIPGAKFNFAGLPGNPGSWQYGQSCWWGNEFQIECTTGTTVSLYISAAIVSTQWTVLVVYGIAATNTDEFSAIASASAGRNCTDNATTGLFDVTGSAICNSSTGSYAELNP